MDTVLPSPRFHAGVPHAGGHGLRAATISDVNLYNPIPLLLEDGRRSELLPAHWHDTPTDGVPAVVGINIYAGMLLAELTFDSDLQTHVSNHPTLYSVLSSLGILLGTFIISYPEEHPEWARWSNGLMEFGHYIFPAGSEYSRYYPALGAEILVFGIMFNSTAKRILSSSPLCWIGKMSFAVYLLHAPLIRTLLTWLLYGASAQPRSAGKDDHGNALPPDWIPLTSRWLLFVTLPLFYYLLYRIAQLWVMYIDPFCGRATNWIEEKLFRDDTRMEKPLLLA